MHGFVAKKSSGDLNTGAELKNKKIPQSTR